MELALHLAFALLAGALTCACVGWWRAETRARVAGRRQAIAEAAHGDLCRAVFAGCAPPSSAPVRIQLHPGLVVDGLSPTQNERHPLG